MTRTEDKLESQKKICENKDFCGIVMLSESDNILEFNQHMTSNKMSYIIYSGLESLFKKVDPCENNLNKNR